MSGSPIRMNVCIMRAPLLRTVFAALLFLVVFWAPRVAAFDSMPLQTDETHNCTMNCSMPGEAVCGSDGRTYDNICELKKAQCIGHPISVQHNGQCKGKRCLAEKEYALKIARHSLPGVFVPVCTPDGHYQDVQCHQPTKYCWCVTPEGKPVPGSSTRAKLPHCRGIGKPRRRSPNGGRHRRKGQKRNRKGCPQSDRSVFNGNLIKQIITEYNRVPRVTSQVTDPLEATRDKVVIEWKFEELDRNHDDSLDPAEYRNLRRMVKKVVKPRRCAKTFTRVCDIDRNKKISRQEWSTCLGVDINISFRLFLSLNSDEQRGGGLRHAETSLFSFHQGTKLHGFDVIEETRDLETNDLGTQDGPDCLRDRRNSLEEQDLGQTNLYIPDCTPDGKYELVQCFSNTGFCWCVNEDNGQPIHGTSVKDKKPNCDSPPVVLKPMKGCRRKKKARFLTALLDVLTEKMVRAASNGSSSIVPIDDPDKTFEQQVAEWEFTQLDRNQNMVLDRREWKIFRQWSKQFRKLKKCGKKLPKHCDGDENMIISLDEWITCLNLNKHKRPGLPYPPKRRGRNPLNIYLKSDEDM